MPVSPTMQSYAAEIYRLQQDFEKVPLSLLTDHMSNSAQAIANMVQKMRKEGYLSYEPYRGVLLTKAGEQIAMPALRRHRLVEVFLVRVMQYDWASAHELSDVFETGHQRGDRGSHRFPDRIPQTLPARRAHSQQGRRHAHPA